MKQYPQYSRLAAVDVATKSQGFTLIEIVIAMAIIALITAMAYPSYNQYSDRSKLSDGLTGLANLRLELEQTYQDARSYLKAGTTDECAVTTPSHDYFNFTCSSDDAKAFTLTASNKADVGLGAADSYSFSIDQSGVQKTLAFAGETVDLSCWKVDSKAC